MNRKKIQKMLIKIGIGILLIIQLTGQIAMATMGTGMIDHNINHFGDIPKSQVECLYKTNTNNKTEIEYKVKNSNINVETIKSTKANKLNQYGDKNMLTGKVTGELAPHNWYLNRLNNLALAYNKKLNVYSGYRSVELQRQLFNNSDRSGKFVARAGSSRHQVGLAVDVDSIWVKELSNKQLAPYGLYKPMTYEDWHIEPVETKGMTTQDLIAYYGIPSDKQILVEGNSETQTTEHVDPEEEINITSLIKIAIDKEIDRIEMLKQNK